jgi:hypothetical protein
MGFSGFLGGADRRKTAIKTMRGLLINNLSKREWQRGAEN